MVCAQDPSGRSLWALTWSQSREISSGLTPQLLASSGVSPRPHQPSAAQAGRPLASPSAAAAVSAPPVPAVAPETSALAAALAAAQQQLAAHELAERESAVNGGNGDAAELSARLSPAKGVIFDIHYPCMITHTSLADDALELYNGSEEPCILIRQSPAAPYPPRTRPQLLLPQRQCHHPSRRPHMWMRLPALQRQHPL